MKRAWIMMTLAAGCAVLLQCQSPPVGQVLSQAEQAALTPDGVMQMLKDGNQRYVSGELTARDHASLVRDAANGQHPEAIVLSCVDSRIPVETVFDRGIGDLFVARVAGNFENVDILGSMEFATKVSGARLVLVMGHGSCGAVKAAIDEVDLGNITPMPTNIAPAVRGVTNYTGDRTADNPAFVELVTRENVRLTIRDIRDGSSIMREMEEKGDLKIVGALYDMDTGAVEFFE
jgi:carbonic anhydrase